MSDDQDVTWGSDNIFADIGLPEAEAEEELLKAQLAQSIRIIIKRRGLTQVQAGKILGLAQSNVSKLLAGKLEGFSIERLLRFITAMGSNVDITLRSNPDIQAPGRVTVLSA